MDQISLKTRLNYPFWRDWQEYAQKSEMRPRAIS